MKSLFEQMAEIAMTGIARPVIFDQPDFKKTLLKERIKIMEQSIEDYKVHIHDIEKHIADLKLQLHEKNTIVDDADDVDYCFV